MNGFDGETIHPSHWLRRNRLRFLTCAYCRNQKFILLQIWELFGIICVEKKGVLQQWVIQGRRAHLVGNSMHGKEGAFYRRGCYVHLEKQWKTQTQRTSSLFLFASLLLVERKSIGLLLQCISFFGVYFVVAEPTLKLLELITEEIVLLLLVGKVWVITLSISSSTAINNCSI